MIFLVHVLGSKPLFPSVILFWPMARSLPSAILQLAGATAPPRCLSALTLFTAAPLLALTITRGFSSAGDLNNPQPQPEAAEAAAPPSNPPGRNPLLRNLTSTPPTRSRSPMAFTGTIQDLIQKSRLYNLSVHRSLYPMRPAPRRKIKRIHLPTHYVEVSYKLRKAVVFYQPSIAHIPHGIKDRNPVLVTSGATRGQNT